VSQCAGAYYRAAPIRVHGVRRAIKLLRDGLRRLAIAAAALCGLWVAGLIWFATAPSVEERAEATDAIVVLTGGSLRLHSGIALLREGKGRMLFISGVNHQVDLDDLLRGSGGDSSAARDRASCCLVLGYQADDTLGNALETARWIRQQGFHSLRLVTAWYHMPRSLLEFNRAMPEIEIVAHPVFPEQVKYERWWARRGTAMLLVNEYAKYLATLVRPFVEDIGLAGQSAPPIAVRAEPESAKSEIR
jgi:uncharacterized SAM-binding protein YcdF (DUF218 family)